MQAIKDGVYIHSSFNNLNIILKVEDNKSLFGVVTSEFDPSQEKYVITEIIPTVMSSIYFDPTLDIFIVEQYNPHHDASTCVLCSYEGKIISKPFSCIMRFRNGFGIVKTYDGYENIIDSKGNTLLQDRIYRHVSYPDNNGLIYGYRDNNKVDILYYAAGTMNKLMISKSYFSDCASEDKNSGN